MQQTILLQPAYILHTRAYRDTSLLLEIFSRDHGRLSAVGRSARGPKSRFRGMLQQFVPLLLSWQGRGELMNLSGAEGNGLAYYLTGDALLCGIYLNELLMRLLHRHDAHPGLFIAYQQALKGLQSAEPRQITLRLFEKKLLLELGYALQLDRLSHTQQPITSEGNYYFDPVQGLLPCLSTTKNNVFSGASLLALQHENFTQPDHLQDAKRLLRLAITSLLDNKPLKSRELFVKTSQK